MSTSIDMLKKAISELPKEDLQEFRLWFEKFDAEIWDEQIKQDVASGKIDYLAEKAIADYLAGKAKAL